MKRPIDLLEWMRWMREKRFGIDWVLRPDEGESLLTYVEFLERKVAGVDDIMTCEEWSLIEEGYEMKRDAMRLTRREANAIVAMHTAMRGMDLAKLGDDRPAPDGDEFETRMLRMLAREG